MSIKKDSSGRRYIQAEVEVPGTPEEVWQAIATGEGVSSWFVPTERRDDGTVVSHFGPGMDSVARETVWEPPHRFAAESEGLGPGAPKMATEWIVEARSGGTCIVRVVHSLFTSKDDWDNQLESIESGWPSFFRILKLYLTYFRGMPCSAFQVMGSSTEALSEAWKALSAPLGLAEAAAGEQVEADSGLPPFAGIVERASEREQVLLRLDKPAPGIGFVHAMPMGGQALLMLNVYLYGELSAAVASRDEPRWQAWMSERFPFQPMSCSG